LVPVSFCRSTLARQSSASGPLQRCAS
jgi:hypothetical protein